MRAKKTMVRTRGRKSSFKKSIKYPALSNDVAKQQHHHYYSNLLIGEAASNSAGGVMMRNIPRIATPIIKVNPGPILLK